MQKEASIHEHGIPFAFNHVHFPFIYLIRVKVLAGFYCLPLPLKFCTTMTELPRNWAFPCGSSINFLITLHAKAGGKLKREMKNGPLGKDSWVAEKVVADWGCSNILF